MKTTSVILLTLFVMGLALSVKKWAYEVVRIPTPSMSPSILPGDYVLVEKWRLVLKRWNLERGEAIVFQQPGEGDIRLVKRIAGLPGDFVQWKDHRLSLNGSPLPRQKVSDQKALPQKGNYFEETNGRHSYLTPQEEDLWAPAWSAVILPGTVVVLGDNRDYSVDSRTWGSLDQKLVVGHPTRVLFSRNPSNGQVKWGRIGKIIP